MMKNLWYISSLVLILTSCNSFICQHPHIDNTAKQRVAIQMFDTIHVRKFQTRIAYKNAEITGILICKNMDNSALAGSFLNEFGIKGFDFTINENKAKLGYVFKKLDKWYIRKKLESDLLFIFSRPLCYPCIVNDTNRFVYDVNHTLHYVYYKTGKENNIEARMYKRSHIVANMQQYYNESAKIALKMNSADGSISYEFNEITN